tara:strand:- start:100 stop:444 length:345 start_codon:yes stop_codon:yes gene_type:complete
MIDTDKYEGHTPGPWEKIEWETPNPQWDVMLSCPEVGKFASIQGCEGWKPNEADVELMADAPLILQALIDERAEVKRLRGDFKGLGKSLKQQLPHCKDKEMIEWIIEKIQEMIE